MIVNVEPNSWIFDLEGGKVMKMCKRFGKKIWKKY